MRKDMYLNCPFCPAVSYLVRDAEHSDRPPLEKYRCCSKHVFYVEEEHNGDTEEKLLIEAYVDGACRVSNPGLCSASFVVYKDNAKYHEQGRVLEGRHTNNEAEYTALLDLLEWLYKESLRKVIILSDSKLVINQVLHNWECNGLLRPLRDKAYGLFISGGHILKHVKGHEGNVGNEAADALCNALLDKYQEENDTK